MSQKNTVTEHFLAASSIHLEDVLEYMDELHTAASEGSSQSFTGMDEVEVMNFLRDIIYTAQESIVEIESLRARKRQRRKKQPMLRIVSKVDKAG
jgi:hypothetical protein